jgi:hypothetical protein
MEEIKQNNEIVLEQELKEELDRLFDFMEEMINRIDETNIDTKELLANMNNIFTKERIGEIVKYSDSIEEKAKSFGNKEIHSMLMPFDSALFQLKYALENNLYNNLPENKKIDIGGQLIKSMKSLIATRKFFSDK